MAYAIVVGWEDHKAPSKAVCFFLLPYTHVYGGSVHPPSSHMHHLFTLELGRPQDGLPISE